MARFRAQPYNVGAAYSRFGTALQGAFEAPQKAMNMIEDFKTRKANRKIAEYNLEQAEKETEKKELNKDYMDATIMSFIDAYEGIYDEPGVSETVEGPPTPQTQKLNSKMSQNQFMETVTTLGSAAEAGDSDKFRRIMGNVSTLIQQPMPNARDYGGAINLNQWSAADLDKEGFLEGVRSMNDEQITSYFDKTLPGVLNAYESQLPADDSGQKQAPTEDGAIAFMTKRPEYSNIPNSQMQRTDGWKTAIKDRYQTKKEVAQTAEAGAKAVRTEMTNQEKANDWLYKKKEAAEKTAEKSKSLSRRAEAMADSVAAQRILDSEPTNTLQAQTAFNSLRDEEKNELLADSSAQIIKKEAGGDISEDMYDTIVQLNGGNMPGIKNYGDYLTALGENRPPEDESFKGKIKKGVEKVKEKMFGKEEAPAGTTTKKKARDKTTGQEVWVEVDENNKIIRKLGPVR